MFLSSKLTCLHTDNARLSTFQVWWTTYDTAATPTHNPWLGIAHRFQLPPWMFGALVILETGKGGSYCKYIYFKNSSPQKCNQKEKREKRKLDTIFANYTEFLETMPRYKQIYRSFGFCMDNLLCLFLTVLWDNFTTSHGTFNRYIFYRVHFLKTEYLWYSIKLKQETLIWAEAITVKRIWILQ